MSVATAARTTAGTVREAARAAVETENWRLLRLFNYYRLAIAVSAGAVAFLLDSLPPFGSSSPDLFAFTSLCYLLLSTITVATIHFRRPDFDSQATLLGFSDITVLTILLHASGGVGSGAELLLLVAIAGIAIMLSKQITLFYASIATIAVLLEHGWGGIHELVAGGQPDFSSANFPQAGLFGLGLYATAFIGNTLATRLRVTEALAERHGVDLANLAQLNSLVIQRLNAGVLVCDEHGGIALINQAAQRFLGVEPRKGIRLRLSEAAPDLAVQIAQWRGKDPAHRQRKVFRTTRNFTLLPRFVPLGDGGDTTLVFLEDMSILKQQAQQLKMSALARLTASIAHEIRNPLGALSNAAQLLSESASDNSDEMRLVRIIDEQSRRMNIIVQNVTQLSRRDRVHPVPLSLLPWIKEFTQQFSDLMGVPQKAFVLPPAMPTIVCFDPEQLRQVVTNLCQNALRHCPPFEGIPLITLEVAADAEGRTCLDVIDRGTGVPVGIADNIFDPFFTTASKGTGLGLYIARELCEGNGGALDYRPSDRGTGSIFRITFAPSEECAEFDTP